VGSREECEGVGRIMGVVVSMAVGAATRLPVGISGSMGRGVDVGDGRTSVGEGMEDCG